MRSKIRQRDSDQVTANEIGRKSSRWNRRKQCVEQKTKHPPCNTTYGSTKNNRK